MRWATVALVGASVVGWSATPAMAAQKPPTAERAQQYLAWQTKNVPTQVRFVDAAGRANYVTGKYTGDVRTVKGGLRKTKETVAPLPERVVDKQLADVRASALEAVDAYGRPNACATRVAQVEAPAYDETKSDVANDTKAFSFTVTTTNEQWTYEPLTKFMNPGEVIDWSSVQISRSYQHHVTVTAKGQGFATIQLTYLPQNLDLADQIEYWMKVLAMSCNAVAGKGI